MAFDPARLAELIDQLANRLQTLLLLASDLLGAASEASAALKAFRHSDGQE